MIRRVATFAAVVAVVVAITASSAAASARAALHVSVGHPASEHNPALVTSQDGDLEGEEHFSPTDCLDVMSTSCDLFDVKLDLPPKASDRDVLLDIALQWDTSAGNQLWLTVFERRTAPDGTPYSGIVLSADSGKSPTKVEIVNPEQTDYVLRVTNRHGVNHGYNVRSSMTPVPLSVPVDHSLDALPGTRDASTAAPPTRHGTETGDAATTDAHSGFATRAALDVKATPAAAHAPTHGRATGRAAVGVVAGVLLAMTLGVFARRSSRAASIRALRLNALLARVRDARLFWKLLMPFLVIILAGGVAAAFLTTRYLTTRASTQLDQLLLQHSVSADGYLRDREARLVDAQRFAANTEGLPEAVAASNTPAAASAMASALAVNKDLDLLAAVDRNGVGVAEFTRANGQFVQSTGSSFGDSRSIDRVLHGGDPSSVGAPEIVRVADRAVLATAGPVSQNAVVGAMVAGVRIDTIVRDAARRTDGAVAVYDATGQRVAASAPRAFHAALPPSVHPGTTPVREREHFAGRSQATIYTPIREAGTFVGTLAVNVPTASAYAAVSGARTQLILIVLAVMAAVVALGALVSRSVLRRVNRLVETNRALGAGDLTVRAPALGGDELGELGAGFNVMAEQLQASYADMERRVDERTEELQRLYQDVVRGNEARSDLFASISHEFRTPIFAILAHAELMADPQLRPTGKVWVREFADTITEAAQILLRRVDDILELAKLESTELELHVAPFALGDVVERIRPQVGALARQAGLTLTVALPDGLPLVKADAQRVEQILLNLLSNAIKYNRPDGSVTIDATSVGADVVRVSVTDTGVGIPRRDGERIFEPFYRVASSPTTHSSSGLGLALAKRLAEAQGGTIRFSSKPGAGSTFIVSLPAA